MIPRLNNACRKLLFICLSTAFAYAPLGEAAQKKAPQGPSLIRDAEIEGYLRQLSKPIFKAARLNPDSVRVYVIADDSINAFVAGGQRIFINTGLFSKTKSPDEIILASHSDCGAAIALGFEHDTVKARHVTLGNRLRKRFPHITITVLHEEHTESGETREWELVEYVQDMIASGQKKALVILGHVVSEQSGMKFCAEWLGPIVPEVPVEFVAASEPFWLPAKPVA